MTPLHRAQPLLLLFFGCVLVTCAYWIGLSGPLLLDDFGNLADIGSWLAGDRTWESAIFNNRSGPLGRPVAMATFVLDAALWGNDIWYAKLTNLVLHLGCGIALFGLYSRLLARDPQLSAQRWLPAYLALLWLALPINVSSVLYIVQRMAMLSALFMLLAMWLYVAAREAIEEGKGRGVPMLWLGLPLLTGLAMLSKENGALVPLMALAVELVYFHPTHTQRRPLAVRAFFAITIVIPAIIACGFLALHPHWLTDGYRMRDFSLAERLLTEPRILWDYVTSVLMPYGPRLGLFHDNFAKSTSVLEPWTTLPAIFGWVAVISLAWRLRLRHPAITAGVLLYLSGHAMESTVFPLELYFEHRNYLPSAGILLAVTGGVSAIAARMPPTTAIFRATMLIAVITLPIVYLVGTHGRARVWSSLDTLYAQELRYNPNSVRLRSFLAGRAMDAGNMGLALEHIDAAEQNGSSNELMTLSLWRVLAYCSGKKSPPPASYELLARNARGPIETYAMVAWEQVVLKAEQDKCPGLDIARVTATGQAWLAQNPLPATSHPAWRTRYYLARLLAMQSRFDEAIAEADRAWHDSAYNNGIGVFLFQINATQGNTQVCRTILARLQQAKGHGDLRLDQAVATFEAALKESESSTPPPSQ